MKAVRARQNTTSAARGRALRRSAGAEVLYVAGPQESSGAQSERSVGTSSRVEKPPASARDTRALEYYLC